MFGRRQSIPNLSKTSSNSKSKSTYKNFIGFLESDMWQIPVTDFEERNSIVFDREQNDPQIYQHIHTEFNDLVDSLVQSYCHDSKIDSSELVEALKEHGQKSSQREKILLEPVVAARNFNVFVPMMMRKNVELQLQALKMMEHISGLLPSSLKLNDEDSEIWNVLMNEDESERLILVHVLRQSKLEWEKDKRMRESLQKEIDAATEASLREKELLESMIQLESKRIEQAMRTIEDKFTDLKFDSDEAPKLAVAQPVNRPQKVEHSLARSQAASRDVTAKKRMSLGDVRAPITANPLKAKEAGGAELFPGYGYRSLLKEREGVPEESIRRREAYLREQRDKLMEKKRKERERQLVESMKLGAQNRPQTAKAARGALSRGSNGNELSELERRKAIAAKIKSEVVNPTK